MSEAHERASASHGLVRDTGSATVEFALVLPALVVVLGIALSGAAWTLDLQAAQRAASESARAAITSDDATARAVGGAVGGLADTAAVTVTRSGGYITACVTVSRAPWPVTSRCAVARNRP